MSDCSTVKEQGGWMQFSTSSRALCLNKKIGALLGVPYVGLSPEKDWVVKYLNQPLPIEQLEAALTMAAQLQFKNQIKYLSKPHKVHKTHNHKITKEVKLPSVVQPPKERNKSVGKFVSGDFVLGFGPLKGLKPIDCLDVSQMRGLEFYISGGYHNELQMIGITAAHTRLTRAQAKQHDWLRTRLAQLA